MIVSCARCKYQGTVDPLATCTNKSGNVPAIWICDVCALEVAR